MKLKILGISGSPRKGNSEFLLKKSIDYMSNLNNLDITIKTEKYSFRGKTFKPCLGCNVCGDNGGHCIQKDDFEELKDKWMQADIIIYSVPIYHMSVPGQVKCFLDRLGNSSFGAYKNLFDSNTVTLPKLMKVIGIIVQGIHVFSGQEHTITELINHALMMQSIPVTGDMWESYIGIAGWTNNKIERNAMEEDYKKKDFDTCISVKAAERLALRTIQMAMIIKSGVKENSNHLIKDKHYIPLLNKISNS
jgi:multimeric flavodoxin WrbA